MKKLSFRHFSKTFLACLAGSISLTSAAVAQVPVFSADFNSPGFSSGAGYTPGNTLSGQNGWTSNDNSNGNTYTYPGRPAVDIGQSDTVDFIQNFTTPNNGENSAYLGGFRFGAAPGQRTSILAHTVAPGAAPQISVDLDFGVSGSDATGQFIAKDTFAFAFRDSAQNSLFTIRFSPQTGNTGQDNIGYTSSNAAPNTGVRGIALNARYHLSVNINTVASNFSATLFGVDQNGAPINFVIASGVSYDSSFAFSEFAATWTLTDATTANSDQSAAVQAYTRAGSNGLAFDNLVVAVPEPSTYAMLALGAFGLVVFVRSRRTARA